jgi:hypothetical protein
VVKSKLYDSLKTNTTNTLEMFPKLFKYNKQIGQRLSEYTLEDNPTMDDIGSNTALKSSGRLRQEEEIFKNHRFL